MRACPKCGNADFHAKFVEPPFIIVRCKSCSLVFLGNPPDEDRLYDEYYTNVEPDPDNYRKDSDDGGLAELFAINQQRLHHIKKIKGDGRLLDIGCGRGFFLKSAVGSGFDAHGIDVSQRAIGYATRRLGVSASVRHLADVASSDRQYDIVTLWHVLEHFINPFEMLRAIRSILAPGGICIVEVPNLHSLKFILARQKWEGGNHPLYHRTFFSAKTLNKALSDCGYSNVRREQISYRLPERTAVYNGLKRALNFLALDAFLDFTAWKR